MKQNVLEMYCCLNAQLYIYIGEGVTVWEGSAFQCLGSSITLRHSQFNVTEKPLYMDL